VIAALTAIPWLGGQVDAEMNDDGIWESSDDDLARVLNQHWSASSWPYSSPAAGSFGCAAASAAHDFTGGKLTVEKKSEPKGLVY
jgi:hypothetical protein